MLKKGETVQALVETENYAALGGPAPYHDSYTFSIYTEGYDPAMIRRQTLGTCLENGAVLAEVVSGEDIPRRSFGRRLRDFL